MQVRGINVLSVKAETLGDFTVSGDAGDYSYSGNILTISGGGEYTIGMAAGVTETKSDRIKVTSGQDVTIIFDSLNIIHEFSLYSSYSPFEIDCIGNVTIKLKGENSLKLVSTGGGFSRHAALQKKSLGNTLTITSAQGDGSTYGILTAYAVYGDGAGIGAREGENCENLTINGGTIEAVSCFGAAIGGGYGGSGTNIRINGGDVLAYSNTTAGTAIGQGGSDGETGQSTEVYITPSYTGDDMMYGVQWSEDSSNKWVYYGGEHDISQECLDNVYFHFKETSEYEFNWGDTLNTADVSLRIEHSENGSMVLDSLRDKILADYALSETDINVKGANTSVEIIGGKIGTIKGSGDTVVNIQGEPECSIDLSTLKDKRVNVTGPITTKGEPLGSIKLLNCENKGVVVQVNDSENMIIENKHPVEMAFSASNSNGNSLSLYPKNDNTIIAEKEGNYTLSAVVEGKSNYNAGDEIDVNINIRGDADSENIGSLNFALEGNWFTVEEISVPDEIKESDYKEAVNLSGKSLALTGVNINCADTDVTVANVKIRVNKELATGSQNIGFPDENSNKIFVTPVDSLLETIPTTAGASVNVYNIKVAINRGNAVFNGEYKDSESITAYVKYNEAGLYSDSDRTIALTLPELTANDGYRLADGTIIEPLWIDNEKGISISGSLELSQYQFTEDLNITASTIKQNTVTINQVDGEGIGNIGTEYLGANIVDKDSYLSEVIKEIKLLNVAEGTYAITGWSVTDSTGTNIVQGAELENYKVTEDIIITPVVESIVHKISEINCENASVTGINVNDSVSYGEDITFDVTTDTRAKVFSVSYAAGNGNVTSIDLNDDNSYTIPGSEVTGDISIFVTAKIYREITLQAGEGNSMTSALYYVWNDEAGLYTSLEGLGKEEGKADVNTVKSDLSADEGYRLGYDTVEDPLWTDGTNNYTTKSLLEAGFTSNVSISAVSVKQYKVAFESGGNGSVAVSEFVVDTGKTVNEVPQVQPEDYYVFSHWDINGVQYSNDELKALAIDSDIIVTAVFKPASYNISFAGSELGTFENITGVTDGKAYYMTDVTFGLSKNDVEGQRIDYIYYTVNGGNENVISDDGSGNYVINGADIRGDIVVSVKSQATSTFSFITSDSEKGNVSGTSSFVIDNDKRLTAEQYGQIEVNANAGYKFTDRWIISEDDVLSGGAIITSDDIITVKADRDITFLSEFEFADFNVNDVNGVVYFIEGVDGGIAHLNTDIVFTIGSEDDENPPVVTSVSYDVGEGEKVTLYADENGYYRIPGNVIIGDINIYTDVVKDSNGNNAYFEFISKEEYIGENISVFEDGRKIAVLNSDVLDEGNYALKNGREFFYSGSYNAYVMIVDNEETAETLSRQLTVTNGSRKDIDYSGDVNGSGIVTSGDAGMLNDILGNNWDYIVTDKQIFMFDVEGKETDSTGYKEVYTSDVEFILKRVVGLN